jgi:uncharacterized protein (TIGR03663 family)
VKFRTTNCWRKRGKTAKSFFNVTVVNAPPSRICWAIFIAIALLALAIRLPQLDARPMHTDEAVNAYITGNLLAGEIYKYDPHDKHGPALFLLAEPVVKICGAKNFSELTETELRLTPVIIGSAMILLFGAAVNLFGFIPCLVAALLFAVAPLPVYYSRYFIHETLFVAVTLGLILAGWQTVKKKSIRFAALAGFCAALLLGCKETAVIHFFALACAALCGWLLKWEKFPAPKIFTTAFLVFIAATILLFTWFGKNWSALSELAHAASRFAARAGGEGHAKPFDYYFSLLDSTFVLWLLAAAGGYAVLCEVAGRQEHRKFALLIYGIVLLLIYSAIPYKQPWLALNLWLPFALLCGFGVDAILAEVKNSTGKNIVIVAGVFLLATLGAQTQSLVFKKPADEKNPLAYAHTTDDILSLAPKINELAVKNKITDPKIAVVIKDAWPLPWYLRKFSNVGFWQPAQVVGDADFFITASDAPSGLTNRLENFRPEFFGVRPNVLIVLWTPPAKSP